MVSRDKIKIKGLKLDKKRLINSFKYAFEGILQAYGGEKNLKIHTVIVILVIIFGFILKISYTEWLVCLVLIGLVLMAEFFNTSIEYLVDLVSPEIHPLTKATKDTASAGLLMMSIISVIIGLMIFVPKLISFIGGLL